VCVDYETNNKVIDELRKYNELLKEKLANEDRLAQSFEKEKKELIAKYEKQMKEMMKKTSGDEKALEKQVFASNISFNLPYFRKRNLKSKSTISKNS